MRGFIGGKGACRVVLCCSISTVGGFVDRAIGKHNRALEKTHVTVTGIPRCKSLQRENEELNTISSMIPQVGSILSS